MSSALEEIKQIDLEEWLTLNTAASPTKLKQGQTPDMKNVWTDEKPGSIITAPGFIKVGTLPSGLPGSFCINYFKTSAGTQTFVVSDNSTVWTTVDFQNFTSIITGLSSSFQLRGLVVRDKLWLTNGSDAVRTFDGTSVVVMDGSGGLTPNVPKGRFIAYHDERVWLYHVSSNRSAVFFSSLTDASANIIPPDDVNAWDTADNFLQISEGDADFGTGMILYRGYLNFFKQYSIWRLVGYDEYSYAPVKTRSSTGTRFNESVQILDSLIHLIGVDGIYVFDGEESERISDLIDPATASQTAFGFNQLQQPNTNNQFWEVTATPDWNAGTVPTNVTIDNELDFVAADDSQADFQAGATLTNIDTTEAPGSIKLSRQSSGGSSDRTGQGINAYLDDGNNGAIIFGTPGWLTDGDTTRFTGMGVRNSSLNRMVVDLTADQSSHINIGRIILRDTQADTQFTASIQVNIGTYQTLHGTQGTWVTVGSFTWASNGPFSPLDRIFDFAAQNAIQVSIFFFASGGTFQLTEMEAYEPTYQLTGQFVSKALNYTLVPNSFGNFNADITDHGEGINYFTQSSADGVTWDSPVACTNGGAIGSTLRQYLRWGANFTSDGNLSQWINAVYLGSEYISAIHDTGGNVFAWGPFESDYSLAGQAINFYYRGATTSVGVPSASWNLIVPGGVLSFDVANRFVQFKFEILSGVTGMLPVVNSVTINWIAGTGIQPQTLQNVASVYWRNRYWLSAAGPSATSNNIILIRGKKTFQSPWMLKDWNILSFTRFQDSLYGCSSVDGSIYQLDNGYSKAGAAIDSYFETGDFVFGGFTANVVEIDVEAERTGSWNLFVGWSFDGGNTWIEKTIDLSASSFDSNYIKRIQNVNVTTTRIRFRFRTNGIDTPFQVHRAIIYYKLEVERGSIRGDYLSA